MLISPSLWAVPPFVSFLTLFVLAAVALVKGKGRKVNLLLSGICFLGGLLSIDKALASVVTDPAVALRISRIDHLFVPFIIPLYLHFTCCFLQATRQKWLIVSAYVLGASFSILSQNDLYILDMRRYFFGYYALAGPLMYLFGVATTANTIYCLCLLFRGLKRERDPARRNKTKYILAGLGGAAVVSHLDLLPLAGFAFYPFGNLAFVPLLLLAFAILKHDLLDIGFAVHKGLIYSLLTGLLTAGYALMIVLSNELFRGRDKGWPIVFAVFFFFLIVFVFDPLKKRLQVVIDRVVFKGKYDYQKSLTALSEAMTSMLHLEEIMDKTLRTVTDAMRLDWGCIMLRHEAAGRFQINSRVGNLSLPGGLFVAESSPLILDLGRLGREVTRYNMDDRSRSSGAPERFKDDFNTLGAGVIMPMVFKGNMNGVIVLGDKKTGDLFTSEDLDLLRTLANQCAISVENAKAYRMIEDLNRNLEEMVEDRTRELKDALKEKERAQDLLIRSESLAAVGALVAGVAHELNNPIASVSSLVQSAVESLQRPDRRPAGGSRGPDDEEEDLIEDLKFGLKELDRAKGIVSSLLGISRQGEEYREPVSLNSVCRDALKVLHNQYKHTGVRIVEVYGEEMPKIRGNFANLAQVCLNIIHNAIQAVDHTEGKIVIKTGYDARKSILVLKCEDNGPGIPDRILKDIFKPFFTTKEAGNGTGLGLYICHEIVRRHNGNIFAENNPGGGATFIVELPA